MQGFRFAQVGVQIALAVVSLAAPVSAMPFRRGGSPPPPPRIQPRQSSPPTQKATVVKPQAKPKYMDEPLVTSKRDLDYERLQELLKAGEWADANQLTARILLTIGKGSQQGFLTADQIKKMSCAELQTVDDLWRYYTGWRSGLSAQARVWRKLKGENFQDVQRFERVVGWHQGVLNPDPKRAQIGHMPFRPTGNGGTPEAWGGGWIKAMPERLATCGLIPR